jgi:hypothetical protein
LNVLVERNRVDCGSDCDHVAVRGCDGGRRESAPVGCDLDLEPHHLSFGFGWDFDLNCDRGSSFVDSNCDRGSGFGKKN